MIISKFGGTSIETAERIRTVAGIIHDGNSRIVVLSANGRTTDFYVELGYHLAGRNFEKALEAKNSLLNYYFELIDDLFETEDYHTKAKQYIFKIFRDIQDYFEQEFTAYDREWLITRGEMVSTVLFSLLLESRGIGHHFMFAADLIHKMENGQVDTRRLADTLNGFLEENDTYPLVLTQGFMCTDCFGFPDTLGRGGSDFTASLLGQACEAAEIQIWSDVDGFLNNDPSLIRGALPLANLSFDEAEELAYFGARILHPMTINPARVANIPVILKNTLNPEARGTMISHKIQSAGVKAAASKGGICLITVHSARMLMATGFLRGVFEVFEKYRTSVDMVTTSEVSVSLTIDDTGRLEEILGELAAFGDVSWQDDLSIVCIVGDQLAENRGKVELVFSTLREIPVRMISYGAARNSISLLVETRDRIKALEALNPVILENIKLAAFHV